MFDIMLRKEMLIKEYIWSLDILMMRDSVSGTAGNSAGASSLAGPELYCCLAHLKYSLQARADELVEEVLCFGLVIS